MRDNLLSYIVCPICRSRLELKETNQVSKGEITNGFLICSSCLEEYQIKKSVPRLFRQVYIDRKNSEKYFENKTQEKKIKTKERFDLAWKIVAKKEVQKGWYKDSQSYYQFLPEYIYKKNAICLDAGCGSGADLVYFANKGLEVIGIDITDSVEIAYRNTKHLKNVHVIQSDINRLPFNFSLFDFIYSFGVIHHLADPVQSFNYLKKFLKKDGFLITYLYEDFSDKTKIEVILLKIISMIRRVTSLLPPRLLYTFCFIGAPFILIFLSLPSKILRKFGITEKFADRIPYRHTTDLECLAADLYDRFSPPIEKRFSYEDVKKLYENAGLKDIHIKNYRGWVSWGQKR